MKKAIITGITGQDGSYLAELLLEKGYEVHGLKRRSSSFNTERVDHLYQDPHEPDRRFIMHYADMTDTSNLMHLLSNIEPDEIYNLAAQSHVHVSFSCPEYTADTDAIGVLRLLDAMHSLGLKDTRFYQASTSELFGLVQETPQRETTPFYPRSPYAVAKLYAYWIVVNYREAYGLHASNGILFNHESPRRGETFVTRKITRAVANITQGLDTCLYLGNLNSKRDWGFAGDYVKAMWLMLQQPKPDDYVIATGITTSVRDFATMAFEHAGIHIEWEGEGVNEVGRNARDGQILVRVDPAYFRPTEVDFLLGDASKAKKVLGWQPEMSVNELVRIMVDHDIICAKRDRLLKDHAFSWSHKSND